MKMNLEGYRKNVSLYIEAKEDIDQLSEYLWKGNRSGAVLCQ